MVFSTRLFKTGDWLFKRNDPGKSLAPKMFCQNCSDGGKSTVRFSGSAKEREAIGQLTVRVDQPIETGLDTEYGKTAWVMQNAATRLSLGI